MSETKKTSKSRIRNILRKRKAEIPTNLELSVEQVDAIIKKLVEEKVVVPVLTDDSGAHVIPKPSVDPNAFGSNGCCVDANVSVVGPVSTVGVNRPVVNSSNIKEALTKDKINVVLPKNLKIK